MKKITSETKFMDLLPQCIKSNHEFSQILLGPHSQKKNSERHWNLISNPSLG